MRERETVAIRHIVCDLDGFIRQLSLPKLYDTYRITFRYYGVDPIQYFQDLESFLRWYDPDWHVNLQKVGLGHLVNDEAYHTLFHRMYDPHCSVYPWVKRIFTELQEGGLTFSILTSSDRKSVLADLQEAGCEDLFHPIMGARSVDKLKPHPDGIFRIMEELCFTPHDKEHILIIGDTHVDIQAGQRSGIWTGLARFERPSLIPRRHVFATNPDLIFLDPEDLLLLAADIHTTRPAHGRATRSAA